jgi:hypothetical protein
MGRYFEIATRQRTSLEADAAAEVGTQDNALKSTVERNDSFSVDAPTKETKKTKKASESSRCEPDEFIASMRRLESDDISIGVSDDGTVRLIKNHAELQRTVKDGFTVYTPADMWHYVQLKPHERRLLQSFKKIHGETILWKDAKQI